MVNQGSPGVTGGQHRHHVRVLELGRQHDLAPETIYRDPGRQLG
jgi:hypothetical protein